MCCIISRNVAFRPILLFPAERGGTTYHDVPGWEREPRNLPKDVRKEKIARRRKKERERDAGVKPLLFGGLILPSSPTLACRQPFMV